MKSVVSIMILLAGVATGCDQTREVFNVNPPVALPVPADKPAPQPATPTLPGKVSDRADQNSKDDVAPPQADTAHNKADLAAIRQSGKGDQVSDKFALEAGLSTWQITHDGPSNFQIALVNQEGKEIGMPVNEIGAFKGTLVVRVAKAGDYLLNVKAEGQWSVTIAQPRPTTADGKPFSKSGKGPDLAGFVTLPKGLAIFKVTHAGDGIFRVKLYDRDGNLVEQLFARIGSYEGSKALSIEKEGVYAVGIFANGDWTLKVQ